MPKYLCSYCDVHLNFDSQSGRKQHNRGRKHQENVRGYYAQYAAALPGQGRPGAPGGGAPFGITMLGPAPGGLARPPPFHPYAGGPPGPMSIRTLGPAPNMGGPPRPPHMGPYGAVGGPGMPFPGPSGGAPFRPPHMQHPHMPPPPFMQPGMPPPPQGPSGQSLPPPPAALPSSTPAAAPSSQPPAAAPADGPAKTFINPDRMRALGLQGHQ